MSHRSHLFRVICIGMSASGSRSLEGVAIGNDQACRSILLHAIGPLVSIFFFLFSYFSLRTAARSLFLSARLSCFQFRSVVVSLRKGLTRCAVVAAPASSAKISENRGLFILFLGHMTSGLVADWLARVRRHNVDFYPPQFRIVRT